jgi:hypothetical protein
MKDAACHRTYTPRTDHIGSACIFFLGLQVGSHWCTHHTNVSARIRAAYTCAREDRCRPRSFAMLDLSTHDHTWTCSRSKKKTPGTVLTETVHFVWFGRGGVQSQISCKGLRLLLRYIYIYNAPSLTAQAPKVELPVSIRMCVSLSSVEFITHVEHTHQYL